MKHFLMHSGVAYTVQQDTTDVQYKDRCVLHTKCLERKGSMQ